MAKKPTFTPDEQVEQDTFEKNLAADAAVVPPETIAMPEAVPVVEPVPDEPAPDEHGIVFTVDEHGRYVGPKGHRELFIKVLGARHEHVSETADGRWVYAKS